MSYWIDIKGHPNYKINSDLIPRLGEVLVLGPDTFEGQEGDLTYNVVEIVHRIEAGLPAIESPLLILTTRV